MFGFYQVMNQINVDNISELRNNINFDLENGVYDNFPKLKNQLQYIVNKLAKSELVVNAEKINIREVHFLEGQGYSVETKDKNYLPKYLL